MHWGDTPTHEVPSKLSALKPGIISSVDTVADMMADPERTIQSVDFELASDRAWGRIFAEELWARAFSKD